MASGHSSHAFSRCWLSKTASLQHVSETTCLLMCLNSKYDYSCACLENNRMCGHLEKSFDAVPMCSTAVQKTSAGAFLLMHKILTLPLWARPFNTFNHQSLYTTAITYILNHNPLINTKGSYNKHGNDKNTALSVMWTHTSQLSAFLHSADPDLQPHVCFL